MKETKEKQEGKMAFLKAMLNAIGKIWSFATKAIGFTVVVTIALFVLTVFMPDNVLKALDIVRNLLMEVGIVGFG